MPRPTLITERLVLRPFVLADAPTVQRLAGDVEIARSTLLIPHPYPEGAAEEWIRGHDDFSDNIIFAVALIGFWLGVPFWGNGYMTEAARAVVGYALKEADLNRVFACHFTRNPASGRVLLKIGMQREGTMRQHLVKWGERVDVDYYGIIREDWEKAFVSS